MNWNEAKINKIKTTGQKSPVRVSTDLILNYLRMKIVS
jgi:hypothetical protein